MLSMSSRYKDFSSERIRDAFRSGASVSHIQKRLVNLEGFGRGREEDPAKERISYADA